MRTMERRGVVREGGRRAKRITRIFRRQPSKGASAACGGEEGEIERLYFYAGRGRGEARF
jgi:hypothetical protein